MPFSPQPATRPLSELKEVSLRFVAMPNDDNAGRIAAMAINDAIRRVNVRTWKWSQTYTDMTLSVGTADYDIPNDVKKPRSVERLNTSSNPDGRLDFKDPKRFLLEHPHATDNGSPTIYTLLSYHQDGKLTLNLAPTQDFVDKYPTIRMWYFRKVLFPESDQKHVDIPSEFELFLTWYARWELAATFDPGKARFAESEWRNVWTDLVADDNEQSDWAEHYV